MNRKPTIPARRIVGSPAALALALAVPLAACNTSGMKIS